MIKAFYDSEIVSRFNYAFENIINSNFQVSIYDQNQINHLYSLLCKAYTDSYDNTIKFQNSLFPSYEKNLGSEHMSKDMKRSKKALFKAYGKFKAKPSNENNKDYINAQKSYRKCQRRELYLKELSEVSKLEFVATFSQMIYLIFLINKKISQLK